MTVPKIPPFFAVLSPLLFAVALGSTALSPWAHGHIKHNHSGCNHDHGEHTSCNHDHGSSQIPTVDLGHGHPDSSAGSCSGHDHDHSHDGHQCQTQITTKITDQLVELIATQTRAVSVNEPVALAVREHLATLTAAAVDELQTLAETNAHRMSTGQRLSHEVKHFVMHLNPKSLARNLYVKSVRYGAAIAIAATVGELSEWASLALAASYPNNPLGWLAGAYGALHIGDVIAAQILIGYPYVASHWDRISVVRRTFKTAKLYEQALLRTRRELPIDWSLDPYYDDELGFIILRANKGIAGWMTNALRGMPLFIRRYVDVRAATQERSFPTIRLAQLEKAAGKLGLPTYSSQTPFDARASIVVASLRQSEAGQHLLNDLYMKATEKLTAYNFIKLQLQNSYRHSPHDVTTLPLLTRAEHLRVKLSHSYKDLRKLETTLVHGDQFSLLNKWTRKLNQIVYELESHTIKEDELEQLTLASERILRLFEPKEPGYLENLYASLLHSEHYTVDGIDVGEEGVSRENIDLLFDTITWEAWQRYGEYKKTLEKQHPGFSQLRTRLGITSRARSPILYFRNDTHQWLTHQKTKLLRALGLAEPANRTPWHFRTQTIILLSSLRDNGILGDDFAAVMAAANLPQNCEELLETEIPIDLSDLE